MTRPIVNNGSLDIRDDLIVQDQLSVGGLLTANNFASSGANITGGSVNGVAIGGTSPSSIRSTTFQATDTATFATLQASGTVDLNGTTLNVKSRLLRVGGGTNGAAPTEDDGQDRGVLFHWHDGTNAKLGFFGFDRSQGKFVYVPDASVSAGAIVGTPVSIINPTDIAQAIGFTPANIAGDTFTGAVTLSGAPTDNLHAATKKYVDDSVSNRQEYNADLNAIVNLAGNSGFLKKTGSGAWSLDTSTYLTANQSITYTGDATGSGTTSVALTLAASGVSSGTYGTASKIPALTVDAKGRVTAASMADVAIAASQVTSGTLANARIAQASVTQHQASLSIAESQIPDGTLLARVADSETISGAWTFQQPVTGSTPTQANHLVTRQYVDDAVTGLDVKASVRLATTGALPTVTASGSGVGKKLTAGSNGALSVDGVAVALGDRVLVKNQATSKDNGVYVVSATGGASAAFELTRASDTDGSPISEVSSGLYVFVEEGSTNAGSGWLLTTANPIVLETTGLTFSQFTGLGQVSVNGGLVQEGTVLSVATASTNRIVVNSTNIDLAYSGVTAGTYAGLTVDSYGRITSINTSSSNVTNQLGYTPVNKAGDTMSGTLNLPSNGLVVGTTQLVASGGYVGVGLASPGYRLDVAGDVGLSVDAAARIVWNRSGKYTNWIESDGTSGANYLRFGVGNSEVARLDSAGSLLVGATAKLASERVTVSQTAAGSVANALQLHNTGTTAVTGVSIGLSTMSKGGAYVDTARIQSAASDTTGGGYLMLSTSTTAGVITERLRIDSSGNVGVGLGAPVAKLNVEGGYVAVGTPSNTTRTNTLFAGYGYRSGATTYGNVSLRSSYDSSSNSGSLDFYVASASTNTAEAMRITGAGLVGIGNTAPGVALEVAGSGANGVIRSLRSTASGALSSTDHAGRISLGTSSGTVAYVGAQVGIVADATWTPGTAHPSSLVFSTVPASSTTLAERVRIDASGNVGIGSNAPGARLHVHSAASLGTEIVRVSNSSANVRLGTYASADGSGITFDYRQDTVAAANKDLTFASNGTANLRLFGNGNVGLATSSTTQKLQIGDGTVTGKLFTRLYASAADIMIGQSDASAFGFSAGTAALVLQDSNRSYPLVVGNQGAQPLVLGTNGQERARIDSSGNLGVGTTSPGYKLDVAGPIRTQSGGITFPDGTVQSTAANTSASAPVELSTSSTAQTVLDSVSATAYRVAEYLIQITTGTSYHTTRVTMLHNGTDVWVTESGLMYTGNPLATFDADISSNSLRLKVTPASASATSIKAVRTLVPV